jgi:hypothetical protein
MYKHQITIEIDESMLASYSNEYLATCWHVAQANPADGFATSAPGELAERIGREIIRRWLGDVSPELWHHQGRHHYSHELGKFAKYVPPEGVSGGPEWHHGTWVPRTDAGNGAVEATKAPGKTAATTGGEYGTPDGARSAPRSQRHT